MKISIFTGSMTFDFESSKDSFHMSSDMLSDVCKLIEKVVEESMKMENRK